MMVPDARIPVTAWQAGTGSDESVIALVLPAGAQSPEGAAIVERLPQARPGHPGACPCCLPHAPLAIALHRLYLRRARGDGPFFAAVAAAVPEEEIADALADPLVAPRFRLASAADDGRERGSAFRCD